MEATLGDQGRAPWKGEATYEVSTRQTPQASCQTTRSLLLYIFICWKFKSYKLSSLMIFNSIVGAVFLSYLVSSKNEWNEGFPRFGVVLKDLEVVPKRQEANNYEYNQAVVHS